MEKILVSLSSDIAQRFRIAFPTRQRSRIIEDLLRKELERRDKDLYECAKEVENDETLNAEMAEWDVSVADGINRETW